MPPKPHAATGADLYQEVTDRIVTALEAGVAPWVRPWSVACEGGRLRNGCTGHVYRGINVVLLAVAGFASARWYSYRQAQQLGGQVRKGEKGTRVIYWQFIDRTTANTQDADGDDGRTTKKIPLLKHFTVFNSEQITWSEGSAHAVAEPEATGNNNDGDDYAHVHQLVDSTGARVEHHGVRAYYSSAEDQIVLPPRSRFDGLAAYHATLLHELAHWTGHGSRLDGNLTGRFGSESYAAEELVAQLASAFMCSAMGIDGRLQHAEYVGSWVKVLSNDKRAIFTASRLAQQAADFVLGTGNADQGHVEQVKEAA